MFLKFSLDFSGKIVFDTGAAGGLGLVLANVVNTDIDNTRLMDAHFADGTTPRILTTTNGGKAQEGKEGNGGGRLLAVKCDSANVGEVEEMMERVVEVFGVVDVLIDNAAVNDDMEMVGECGIRIGVY